MKKTKYYLTILKIFLSKKITISIIFFLIGLIIGYVLGFFKVHQYISIIDKVSNISIDFSWFSWVGNINPHPRFLSNVAAFEAVIIAFLVPLSIEIISKLSERYNSDVINRSFERYWANKILPTFLLINIVVAIVLGFFIQDDINSTIWKILAWIVLFSFICIAFTVWRVIKKIKTFMGDTQSVINQLYQDVEDSLQ